MIESKQVQAYVFLVMLVVCGLATATVTASKVVHLGVNFPFSNLVFSVFTYPIVDCISELWGQKLARQALYIGLIAQVLVAALIQASISIPHASFWVHQSEFTTILASSQRVLIASLLAFYLSQILDIAVYQRLKQRCQGRKLWLRSNVSTILGQIIDSSIFVGLVFSASQHKFDILLGSVMVKSLISILMTPVVYLLVYVTNEYLDSNTQAFS